MAADEFITVAAAAARLNLTTVAVRKLLARRALVGTRVGRDWAVEAASVERRLRLSPPAGRPLAQAMCWTIILELSGSTPASSVPMWRANNRARARRWLGEHPLPAHAASLRQRAQPERFRAHPSQLSRLLAHEHLLPTGLSAGQTVGLAGASGEQAELYAPVGARDGLVRRHGLFEGAGNVLIRWVNADLWDGMADNLGPANTRRDQPEPAPRIAVLLDLLESDDPRARREARAAQW